MAFLAATSDDSAAMPQPIEDMDIDMDLDFSIDPSYDGNGTEIYETSATSFSGNGQALAAPAPGIDDTLQPDAEPRPDRIHIRGLESLSNDDVKALAREHYDSEQLVKVEWINDASANLVYQTADAALEALQALTLAADTTIDLHPMQLRPAKKLSTHPLTDLYVRQATTSDVKKKNAYDESRYYLLHPDQDPREKKRRLEARRPRVRRGSDDNEYRKPRYDDKENRKRRHDDVFTASMYDEEASTMSDTDISQRKKVRFGKAREDLLEGRRSRQTGRLRDRSASPHRIHDGDGRYGFGTDDDSASSRRIRTRTPTPPRFRLGNNVGKELFPVKTNAGREFFPTKTNAGVQLLPPRGDASRQSFAERNNAGKELFPTYQTGSSSFLAAEPNSRDLFADKLSSRPSKELFPNKTERSNHRRTEAVDHSPSSSVDLVNGTNGFPDPKARALADRITGGSRSSLVDRISGGTSLADRMTGGPEISIRGAAAAKGATDELHIRGAAAAANTGFSIRGAAASQQQAGNPFAMKTGASLNAGKELFAERIKGRGGPRRRAEDMW